MNKSLTTLLLLAVSCASALAQAQGPAGAAAGSQSMQGKVAMCIGCHGIPGYRASFPEVHRVPMISGQSAGYIAAALKAYRKGDRRHPSMRGVADSLSDQDINDIAAYYESHGAQGGKTADRPNREPSPEVAALLQKAACASCHGANFSKPIDPSYPKIAGQHADYMFVALKAYKEGSNPTVGRNNAVMGAIVKQFSNAELKVLSDYVSSLDGELLVKPESRFR